MDPVQADDADGAMVTGDDFFEQYDDPELVSKVQASRRPDSTRVIRERE